MSTQKQQASNNVLSTFANSIKRLFAHDASAGSSDLLQLYLLSRGSDSVRPAVIRKLQAAAAQN